MSKVIKEALNTAALTVEAEPRTAVVLCFMQRGKESPEQVRSPIVSIHKDRRGNRSIRRLLNMSQNIAAAFSRR